MSGKIADKIMKGAREAAAYTQGQKVEGVVITHVQVPEQVDVAAIRSELKMSQSIFAETFGFSLSAVRKWEQGQRTPEKPIRILLRTIQHNPGAVIAANMSA